MSLYRLSQLTPREFELVVKNNLDALSGELTDYRSEHREVLEGMDGEYEIDITLRFTAFGGASFLTLVTPMRKTKSRLSNSSMPRNTPFRVLTGSALIARCRSAPWVSKNKWQLGHTATMSSGRKC